MASQFQFVRISSWLCSHPLSWICKISFYILKWGTIPKHVAIIMDGNRRYADKENIKKVEGHTKGFNKMQEMMDWCSYLGISEITVYAFSIENFKRSQEEINALMDLTRDRFTALINDWEKFREHGTSIRIIGNLTNLPKDIIILMIISMLLTKDNKRSYLNMAVCYTSKEELINTSYYIIHGLRQRDINDVDVTEDLLSQCLYTYQSPDPEIIMRTSGEIRLSNFLGWQGSKSHLHFDSILWPEFSTWNFLSALFYYQHFTHGRSLEPASKNKLFDEAVKERFSNMVQTKRLKLLVKECNKGSYFDVEKLFSFDNPEELYHYYQTSVCK